MADSVVASAFYWNYTVSQKNAPTLSSCSFSKHLPTL